jgi:hypothetical protein
MAVKITDKNEDFKRMEKEVAALKGRGVKVGIMGEGKVLEYAMYNEFGTSRIPARPFMQTTFDNNKDEMDKFVDFLGQQIIDGKNTVDRVLRLLGETYQMKVQKTIREAVSWAVPNDPKTIEMKGSSSPLIDEGRMIGAVRYEIHDYIISRLV